MTQEEALRMALEAIEYVHDTGDTQTFDMCYAKPAIAAIKKALAQEQEQEPVGQLLEDAFGRGQVMWFNKPKDESMLYTTPQSEKYPQIAINPEIVGYVAPQRTWVDLTRAQFAEILCDDRWQGRPELMLLQAQSKLKEKNNG